jgi:phosphoribosylaminoimidazole-succinocarboxamide synthase
MPEQIKHGSVKDIHIIEDATSEGFGKAVFHFTDHYSVFDWGRMPDIIEGKGASLCMMGAFNFELLKKKGVRSHYVGLLEHDVPRRFNELNEPTNKMVVRLVNVPVLPFGKQGYDYDAYKSSARGPFLVPLEVIFRNSIPIGSSARERYSPADLGLSEESWPDERVELKKPLVEFSTKLEEKDRYLTMDEARTISCLSDELFEQMVKITKKVNKIITEHAKTRGMTHEDGKIEFAVYEDKLYVVDVVGTFDENRFSFVGKEISKEVIRQWYKHNHKEWIEAIANAKKRAREQGVREWQTLCNVQPMALPDEFLQLVAEMYQAGCNHYTGKELFTVRPLGEVLAELYKNQ